jgi:hypothetical protein
MPSTGLRRAGDRVHHGVVRGDGAGANAVFIREPARQHERVEPRELLRLRPVHELAVEPDGDDGAQRLILAVRSRKHDDRDVAGAHAALP